VVIVKEVDLPEPHEELIATESAIPSGDGEVSLHFPRGRKLLVFKAFGAERVDGIDYDAFRIRCVFVGQRLQVYNGNSNDTPWPATDLFKKWGTPMSAVQTGLWITIRFRNVSDKPQRFAIKLVGKRRLENYLTQDAFALAEKVSESGGPMSLLLGPKAKREK